MSLLSTYQDFKSSECSFLAAFGGDQPVPLGELATELDAHSLSLERACRVPTPSVGVAQEYAQAAVNIQVLASAMTRVHASIENLMEDFVQKLDLSPATTHQRAIGSAAASQRLSMDAPETFASPPPCSNLRKDPQDLLRCWSSQHLSYLFPTKEELMELSGQTKLSAKQVDLWFRNARTRSGWSKLFTNKLYANKDRQKLESYFSEYEATQRLHCSKAGSFVSSDDAYKLVEKVLKWFRVKESKDNSTISACLTPSVSEQTNNGSVSPWVKDVLFSTLAALRTSSPPSPTKKCHPTLRWPNIFSRAHSEDIDPSLRSSSPASSSEATPSCSSTSGSSTWSSVSTSSSRSSSPCTDPSVSSPQRSKSPQSTSPPPSTSPSLFISPLFSSPTLSPDPLSQIKTSPPPELSICLSPQPDPSTSLLSFLCSDSFSPPSPTHEPCSIASGQFDDAEED
ncbi:TALE-type homeodomain protein [Melampsora larici-populina 98AG31]|uniref:TALE-type homeodomain protein n=1 Tax=Melampsora larici-populina (strain 98AG31 / pathotype 3-4-7) TaxID=747676 RepID=F4RVY2_MELLP|nr:TALE-type homeodomain protein [Melampsora larici-populina 98AG31]EGG03504.1 TALE-type homeodomain protein [Melampsora larici-populina 98AG31]